LDDEDLPLAFLTASHSLSRSSAVVLSTSFTEILPWTWVEHPKGSGTMVKLNWRVGHPMFSRALLREAAYMEEDILLADLPVRINGPGREFNAEFQTNSDLMRGATFRQFFPPFVRPGQAVMNSRHPITFGQVILDDEVGQLYDDRSAETFEHETETSCGAYVLLKSTKPDDLANRSPKSPAVQQTGFLFNPFPPPPGEDPVLEIARSFFQDTTRGDHAESGDLETRQHFPLKEIRLLLIPQLQREHSDLQFDEELSRNARSWGPLGPSIWKLNGLGIDDVYEQAILEGWTSKLPLEEVMRWVIWARCAVAKAHGVSLDKEPFPTFQSDLDAKKEFLLSAPSRRCEV
jgi:hypothetical protein